MPQYDICLGSSIRDVSARVLMTATDQDSADTIVSAINGASLFQAVGQTAFARSVERDQPATVPEVTERTAYKYVDETDAE